MSFGLGDRTDGFRDLVVKPSVRARALDNAVGRFMGVM